MASIKINQKNYIVPNLTFRHYTQMEEMGLSLIDAFQKKQIMLLAMGFVGVVVGCDRDEAERLIEQHVLGGGNLLEITEAMYKSMAESDFSARCCQSNRRQRRRRIKIVSRNRRIINLKDYKSYTDFIYDYYLPDALYVGISFQDFWNFNPKRLRAIQDVYFKNKEEESDSLAWGIGMYVGLAIGAAIGGVEYPSYAMHFTTDEPEEVKEKREDEIAAIQFAEWATLFNAKQKDKVENERTDKQP